MPMYDLKCPKCGHEQTTVCSFAERKNQKCEKCGKKPMTVKITAHLYLNGEGKGR